MIMNGTVAVVRHHRFWVLFVAVLFLMGTSKPLDYKLLTGEAGELPEGLVAMEAPAGYFGENTDNQGCFADQLLDLKVEVEVRNEGEATVVIEEEEAQIFVDGQRQELRQHVYTIGGERRETPFEVYEIEAGQEETVSMFSMAFMPKEALETTREIVVVWELEDEELRLVFEDVDEAETLVW